MALILLECLDQSIKKESKVTRLIIGYVRCSTPVARKFKKASSSKIDSDLVPVDEEPIQKGKRVKRPAKKSTTKPAVGVVIREAPVETKSKKEAQMKEARKKSLRDFHKAHPSGSGTVSEKPPSVDKITPTVISEGTGDKPGVPDVTEDDFTKSESDEQESESEEQVSDLEQEEESEDDDQKRSFVYEKKIRCKFISNEESDDVNKSNEESSDVIKGDKEIVQGEGADAEMIDAQQWNENIPHTDAEIVSPLDVQVT
ncbi:hypothetical protein Tco_1315197 [Tanacetum coccineum]